MRWFRLAADQGDARAQLILGFKYAKAFSRTIPKPCAGFGSLPIRVTPVRSSNSVSCTPTARGLPDDYVLAYVWYNLAAAQGNEAARKLKDNLRTRMTTDQIARAQELSATLFDRIN